MHLQKQVRHKPMQQPQHLSPNSSPCRSRVVRRRSGRHILYCPKGQAGIGNAFRIFRCTDCHHQLCDW